MLWRPLNKMPLMIGGERHRYRGYQVYRRVVGHMVAYHVSGSRKHVQVGSSFVFIPLGSKDRAFLPVSDFVVVLLQSASALAQSFRHTTRRILR